MEYEIRQARVDDIGAIMDVIRGAKTFMTAQHSGQWQDQYPLREQIESDISHAAYFVVTSDNTVVGGVAVYDHDADYGSLLEGAWHHDGPYLVVHRLAVDPKCHGQGLGMRLMLHVEEKARQRSIHLIRLDTHDKNKPMVSLLAKLGYEKVGYVLLNNFKRRAAFEKHLG